MLSHTCPLPALLLGPHSSASRAGLSGQRARRLLTHRKSRKEAADPGRREETHPGEQPGVQFPFNGRLPGPGSLCPVLPSHWPSGALGACPAALLSCLKAPSLASTPVPRALPMGLTAPQAPHPSAGGWELQPQPREAWWPKAWVPDPRGRGRWTPGETPRGRGCGTLRWRPRLFPLMAPRDLEPQGWGSGGWLQLSGLLSRPQSCPCARAPAASSQNQYVEEL